MRASNCSSLKVKYFGLLVYFVGLGPLSSPAGEPLAAFSREEHTDGFEEKIRLIREAYTAEDFDLALSLSESIKDTIACEKQLRGETGEPQFGAESYGSVADLPPAWSVWARGWKHYKVVTLSETIGIARSNEPVDLGIAFHVGQTADLQREVRVARVIPETGTLVEVPSQVYGETRRGHERLCRLVFFADAPAHGTVTYLIFHGNPWAELTDYTTDLRVTGEGYGLDVENHDYVARLSRQTGQLERLTYKRQHGLELYAGGKGHGEPPTIDWANDYVDHDGFQKFRIRNWSECPNYEVVRGPLCVRVRRWGFPHSPVHPLFTPSRMHIDQTYVFYAGKEFFIKEGTMDAVKDFQISAMRDDEWVLSGYSFTNTVWMDGDGKLHEGSVPSEQADNLWGVGFFNPTSRDSFIALWLDHSAVNFGRIRHSGAPTLHYHQHGQLWSRYPADGAEPALKAGASFRQRNAYLVSSYPEDDAAGKTEGLRRQLLNPLVVHTDGSPAVDDANASGTLARDGETLETAPLKARVWRALRQVTDEQLYRIDANIVDMGYVYDVSIRNGMVRVLLTMPHRGRPVYEYFVTQGGGHTTEGIRERLLRIDGIRDVVVDSTWNPPWTVARLTAAGRRSLGLDD